jgi:hypothetical protein
VHAAPPVVFGRQVIGVSVYEQLFEHRGYDISPQDVQGGGRARGGFRRDDPLLSLG